MPIKHSAKQEEKLSAVAGSPCAILYRYAILSLKTSFDSTMDSMRNRDLGVWWDSQAGVLSVLLSILASKRVVLDRQYGRNRLGAGLGSPMDSAK